MKALIKLGSSGVDVRQVQERLVHEGLLYEVTGNFGPKTEFAIRKFQSSHDLLSDGIVGPITWGKLFSDYSTNESRKRLELTSKNPLRQEILRIARDKVGIRENGYNRGPEIDKWLKDLGVPLGNPWCMAFVQGVVKEAARNLGLPDPLKPDSAHCLTVWERTPETRKFGRMDGIPGDIFIMAHGGGRGHTGLVLNYSAGIYSTIEGNTESRGSREGDGVYVMSRKYNDPKLLGFIRVG